MRTDACAGGAIKHEFIEREFIEMRTDACAASGGAIGAYLAAAPTTAFHDIATPRSPPIISAKEIKESKEMKEIKEIMYHHIRTGGQYRRASVPRTSWVTNGS